MKPELRILITHIDGNGTAKTLHEDYAAQETEFPLSNREVRVLIAKATSNFLSNEPLHVKE